MAESPPNPVAARKRLYAKRKKLKRWKREREAFWIELQAKHEIVAEHGHYPSHLAGTVEYPERRIRTLDAQIAELEAEDLRTDEEKRGVTRKPYEWKRPPEYRSRKLSAEQVDGLLRTEQKMVKMLQRSREEEARQMEVPGSRARQTAYDFRRWMLMDSLKKTGGDHLMAAVAIAEKRGEPLAMPEADRTRLQRRVDLLAEIDELDAEFADCEQDDPSWDRIEQNRYDNELIAADDEKALIAKYSK